MINKEHKDVYISYIEKKDVLQNEIDLFLEKKQQEMDQINETIKMIENAFAEEMEKEKKSFIKISETLIFTKKETNKLIKDKFLEALENFFAANSKKRVYNQAYKDSLLIRETLNMTRFEKNLLNHEELKKGVIDFKKAWSNLKTENTVKKPVYKLEATTKGEGRTWIPMQKQKKQYTN